MRHLLGAFAALLLASGCAAVPEDRLAALSAELAPRVAAQRPVLVVAHRGCWKDAPENSLSALEDCIAMGADVAELDVRRTADGVLILMHDSGVDRTTNGQGEVGALTYDYIRTLKLRTGAGGPGAPLTGEAPPTFEAAMIAARGRILINLDAKADVYDDAFAVLRRTGTEHQVIMKRRVTATDERLAAAAPFDRVFAMPIVDQRVGAPAELLARQLQPAPPAVELVFSDLGFLAEAQPLVAASGARSWVNTLTPLLAGGLTDARAAGDPDAVWGRLIDGGVTMIQTDEPRLLIDYLDRIGRRP